ncbi:hypothetical protein NDU88_006958 [Pleurodeles waltl]|uniref:Coiled-coil domain-containing protein 14 n=1 Tax=Pleurodeles waltl TaxID=8319 RepID=A0AAV7UMJ9_PLEWA|nr:hypothetical protein NDU88_006958 [Pleurodeles waltl]
MAKQGLRAHKALSSGRLAGPAKVPGAKKRVAVRKTQSSMNSLCSTDSEDQVVVIHKGLDRCAALLKDILHNEDSEITRSNHGKTVSTKTVSKSLTGKGTISKKKVPKKHVLASHVHKEIVSSLERNTIPGKTAVVNKEQSSTCERNSNFQPVRIPSSKQSPLMQPGLCEHVQTQMSLMTSQVPEGARSAMPSKSCGLVSDSGCQGSIPFNYRLPSSTPALSPQHPATPVGYHTSAPTKCCNQNIPLGGPIFPIGSNAAATVTSHQPISSASDMLSCIPVRGPSNHSVTNYLPPAFQNETSSKEANSDHQPLRDSEMLLHIQAQLTELQQRNAESQRVSRKYEMHIPAESDSPRDEISSREQSEISSSEEEDVNGLDVAPVRDTSCQTSFEKTAFQTKKTSPQKTAQKVNKVKYLLGEIKALISDQDDSEVQRLIAELEESVCLLPAAVGTTNLHADIALALQPLRSENAQLRRRLRILNQQLRERERAEKEARSPDLNFELLSLQSMNITLQSQLSQSQKSLELLQGKNEELLKVINDQKEENKNIGKAIHEREEELLQSKQQAEIEAAKVKIEVEEALTKMKSIQFKLEASEKENNILGITLRQRDAEVHRLRELTRTLQGSMAKLLSDLNADNFRPKPGKTLTPSLLAAYEKQLQNEHCPASTSIMSYLKKLETDNVSLDEEAPFSDKIREAKSPDGTAYESHGAPDSLFKKLPVSEEAMRYFENSLLLSGSLSPISSRSPLKRNINPKSDSDTLLEEDHKPDETMYIPLASSPSKTKFAMPERRMCTPPRTELPPRDLSCKTKISNSENHKHTGESNPHLQRSEGSDFVDKFGLKKKVPSDPELIGSRTKLEEWLPAKTSEKAKDFPFDMSGKVGSPTRTKCHWTPQAYQQANDSRYMDRISVVNSSFSTIDYRPKKTDGSMSSFSTFTSHDEQDFRDGLADLDANIARLQRTLQANFPQKLA